jgi:hypothetical protein
VTGKIKTLKRRQYYKRKGMPPKSKEKETEAQERKIK